MPSSTSPDYLGEAAAAAFAQVLEAERLAEASVVACQAQADDCLAEARAGQRALSEATDARVDAWKARINDAAARRIAEFECQHAPGGEVPRRIDDALQERIVRAVARLADELVGED